jgi:uncharacterized protein (DUF433 family)
VRLDKSEGIVLKGEETAYFAKGTNRYPLTSMGTGYGDSATRAILRKLALRGPCGSSRKRGEFIMPTDIDWSGCSIVECDPEKMGGVPTVRGLRLSADAIVENHDDSLSDEEIAEIFELPIKDVRALVAYAEQVRYSAHSVR